MAKYALRSFMRSRAVPIMYYVYLIRSVKDPSRTYIGRTINLKNRFETHNSGGSIHTKEDRPWKLVVYLAFDCEKKAKKFEKYVKVGSGHAFAKRRFW